MLISRWSDWWRSQADRSLRLVAPLGRRFRGAAWQTRTGTDGSLRITLLLANPPIWFGAKWGDWALATGLARSLQRVGIDTKVRDRAWADHPETQAADVLVTVRGLLPGRPAPGQFHVIWVISHPTEVTAQECADADLIVAASPALADHLRSLSDTPVRVLLQATDHHRFRPMEPDPGHRHDVTVVANTRGVFRPSVHDALEAGLHPAIYGRGWDDLVDPVLIAARHVPNDRLPGIYSSARVVLNDHWDDMRAWGMISNRVFDVSACGTPVISDAVPGLESVFGDSIATYETVADLGAATSALLTDPTAARERSSAARDAVLAGHTFDHRARELLEALTEHGVAAPDGSI